MEREWIVQKISDYRAAYMEHLAMANANHGAMQAMEEALAEWDRAWKINGINDDPEGV